MSKKIQTTVRLEPYMHKHLLLEARKTTRTINNYIIWLVKKDIEAKEKKDE